MADLRCCVCHQTFPELETRRGGGRVFCREHYDLALENARPSLQRSGLVEVVLSAVFVGLVVFSLGRLGVTAMPASLALGALLALFPALLWLVFIYRQDRLEPEPLGLVMGVFSLGGLLGIAVVDPLAKTLFDVDAWRHRSTISELVAQVCVFAALQELCKYLAVRYSVYYTEEFDEPFDGVVYVTAAGLGLAAARNIDFVLHNRGMLPIAGASLVVINTVIHVASSSVLGYGLGRARFTPKFGQEILAGCFLLAVLLNGLLTHVVARAGTQNGEFHPWTALSVALGSVALILTGAHVMAAKLRELVLKETA